MLLGGVGEVVRVKRRPVGGGENLTRLDFDHHRRTRLGSQRHSGRSELLQHKPLQVAVDGEDDVTPVDRGGRHLSCTRQFDVVRALLIAQDAVCRG